jgi:hypothetical protein
VAVFSGETVISNGACTGRSGLCRDSLHADAELDGGKGRRAALEVQDIEAKEDRVVYVATLSKYRKDAGRWMCTASVDEVTVALEADH